MVKQNIGSVTGWIEDLRNKDPEAQRKIWERFVDRLVRYANRKLQGGGCRVVDAEDIANIAFANFFEKSPEQFNRLLNRNDLWQILAKLAERRAIDHIRRESTQKQGGNRLVSEGAIGNWGEGQSNGMDNLAGQSNPADFEAMLIEEFRLRLESLHDDTLRQVAIERMQGYRNREIAERLQVSLRSIERKLSEIRDIFGSAVL